MNITNGAKMKVRRECCLRTNKKVAQANRADNRNKILYIHK